VSLSVLVCALLCFFGLGKKFEAKKMFKKFVESSNVLRCWNWAMPFPQASLAA